MGGDKSSDAITTRILRDINLKIGKRVLTIPLMFSMFTKYKVNMYKYLPTPFCFSCHTDDHHDVYITSIGEKEQ
jgi:hypothetical protein